MNAKIVRTSCSPDPMGAVPSVALARAELTTRPRGPALIRDMSEALACVTSPRRGDDRKELKLEAGKRDRRRDGSVLQGELNSLCGGTLIIRPTSHGCKNVPATSRDGSKW